MRFNEKHGILFKKAPPVAWAKFDGYMYINYEYYSNSIYYDNTLKDKIKYTYNGNYNQLLKFLKMK